MVETDTSLIKPGLIFQRNTNSLTFTGWFSDFDKKKEVVKRIEYRRMRWLRIGPAVRTEFWLPLQRQAFCVCVGVCVVAGEGGRRAKRKAEKQSDSETL